jgi:hypothetical protein
MKIIEAMKKVQDQMRKVDDLVAKITKYCADLDFESPPYGTPELQREQIKSWLQAQHDILKDVEHLRIAIAKTNLATNVTIELDGKQVTKCITGWILRRGLKNSGLASKEYQAWAALTDRNLKDGQTKTTSGDLIPVKIRRYFEAKERDNKMEAFRSEASKIDATLEVINAVTELIEA